MRILHLSVKKEYFDKIKAGLKINEYRLVKPFWDKRLLDRNYDLIRISNGYPKRGDTSRTIERPWKGYTMARVRHKEFGGVPRYVYAIRVN